MTIDYGLFDRVEMAIPLFYPRPDRTPAPPGATDHAIEVAPGVSVAARHYAAAGARGTLLYFHGNGEVVGDHDGIAPLYRAVGLDLFVVDYRGYGGSGGRPSVAALVADAHPVAERFHALLDARGASRARFLMGRSLGSHPAVELAARRPEGFRGMILESTAAHLRRLLMRLAVPLDPGESEALLAAHEAKIAGITMPVLMLHGERDTLIPLEQARAIEALLRNAERSLVVVPGAGHNDILWSGRAQYFEAIDAFVTRHGA